jgi:predicted transcriptional regulator
MDDRPQLDPGSDDGADAGSGGHEARLAKLRATVQAGLDDIKAGRVTDLESAFERIEAMLDELEAAKRA